MKKMYRFKYIAVLTVITLLLGCKDREELQEIAAPVGADLVFSVQDLSDVTGMTVAPTRMADSVVQVSGNYIRDLQDVVIIPFRTRSTITDSDVPSQHLAYSTWSIYPKPDARFYYNQKCSFVQGIASVLVYGRGAYTASADGHVVSGDDKHFYGSTDARISSSLAPADISFAPEQIRPVTDFDEKAEALADYLTSIANTPGWATTTDAKLQALYMNFIGKKEYTVDYKLFAGASANILGYLKELYTEVGNYQSDADLAAAIQTRIKAGATVTAQGVTALNANLSGYPASIDLPDGAAALLWISGEDRFAPQTTTTTIAPITSVTRFAYPAELYYHTNSLISTSNTSVSSAFYESETDWETVLANYDQNGVVDEGTKSVAINTPLQYGVACLSTKLSRSPETFIDGDETRLKYGVDWNDSSFPMTAVIVGGQYPVGFDFVPETYAAERSDADLRYVYDSQVRTRQTGSSTDYFYLTPSEQTGSTNTLLLQSYEKGKVTVVLEFENRSDKKFRGKDGIVYPGTKFYLVGYVDPTVHPDAGNYGNRVFTKDYVTTLTMTVGANSFKNAYCVMPDLLAARMEIGVLLVPMWNAITPTNVELIK